MSSISTSTVTAEQILARLSSYPPTGSSIDWQPTIFIIIQCQSLNPPDYSRPSPAFSSRLTQFLHHYSDTADVNRLEEIKLLVEEEQKYRGQQGNLKDKRIEDTFKLQQLIHTLQERFEGQQQQKQTLVVVVPVLLLQV